jgi:hypothetical protein
MVMVVLGFKLPSGRSVGGAAISDGCAQVKISGYVGDTMSHNFG